MPFSAGKSLFRQKPPVPGQGAHLVFVGGSKAEPAQPFRELPGIKGEHQGEVVHLRLMALPHLLIPVFLHTAHTITLLFVLSRRRLWLLPGVLFQPFLVIAVKVAVIGKQRGAFLFTRFIA